MKIYTKTGDNGTTSLLDGSRVRKDDKRIEAYGTIDELNSMVGMLLNFELPAAEKQVIAFVQNRLFDIGALLAVSDDEYTSMRRRLRLLVDDDIRYLEDSIDRFDGELPKHDRFIIPAGSEFISWSNIARTVCRRAERRIIAIPDNGNRNQLIITFINRLSDLLFVIGRKFAHDNNINEIFWNNDL